MIGFIESFVKLSDWVLINTVQSRECFLQPSLSARVSHMPEHTPTHTHWHTHTYTYTYIQYWGRDTPELPLLTPRVTSWTFCDDSTAGGSEAMGNYSLSGYQLCHHKPHPCILADCRQYVLFLVCLMSQNWFRWYGKIGFLVNSNLHILLPASCCLSPQAEMLFASYTSVVSCNLFMTTTYSCINTQELKENKTS